MTAEHWSLLRMTGIAMILGATLVKTFCPRARISWASVLGLSFPVGMAVIGQTCIVLNMIGVPLRWNEIIMSLTFVQSLLLVLRFLRRGQRIDGCFSGQQPVKEGFRGWDRSGRWLFFILGAYLVYQFYFIVANTFLFPIHVYDAITMSALKSKVFFHDGSLDALKFLPLKSYPLLIPIELFWAALNLGRWDDTLVNIVFPITYFCFSVFQYVFMRERYGVLAALAAVALTVSAAFYNYHASIAYQDFTFMVFNVASQMFMIMCFRWQNLEVLPLAGLCAGLGVCVKMEGAAYWSINAVLCLYLLKFMPKLSFKEKIRSWAVFLLPGMIFYVFHAWFVSSQGFIQAEGRYAFRENIELFERLGPIAKNYIHALFLYNNWTMLWAVLLASLLFFGREAFKDFEARFYVLVILLTFAMFLTVDILTHNIVSHDSILSRVLVHFYPVLPMLIIHLHARFFRRRYS